MKKIEFKNNSEPYLSAETLNQLQGNVEDEFNKIGTIYEDSNTSVSCIANTTNNLVPLTLPAGTYIITSGFRYDGADLRYFHAMGNSQNSSYDNAGAVAGLITYIVDLTQETIIMPTLWPSKDITVTTRTKAIRIK